MISAGAFAALVWGSVAVVLAVFAYLVWVVAVELGLRSPGGEGS